MVGLDLFLGGLGCRGCSGFCVVQDLGLGVVQEGFRFGVCVVLGLFRVD